MNTVKFTILISSLLFSSLCFSGSYQCLGKIDNLFITRDGNIEVYSSEIYGNGIGRKICSTNTIWKSVTPETCKVWISTILAQIAQKKPTRIYYLTEDTANCSTAANYEAAPAPWGISEY
jgi:hypothetical protein